MTSQRVTHITTGETDLRRDDGSLNLPALG